MLPDLGYYLLTYLERLRKITTIISVYVRQSDSYWFQTLAVSWMLYVFFWVIPRRLNFICRRFGTLSVLSTRTYLPMKMEQTECSETSAYKIQTPGNHPEVSIQQSDRYLNPGTPDSATISNQTRCNRGFYCRSYCLLNMFRAILCPSSGAQEYYTVTIY